jgi:hypothetical protein
MPYVDLQQLFDPIWIAGAENYYTSAFLDLLPTEAIQTLADFHRSSADLRVLAELHIHHLGGAIARVLAGRTAFTDRRSPFLLKSAIRTPVLSDLLSHVAWARAARNALAAARGSGEIYLNFTSDGGRTIAASVTHPRPMHACKLPRINTTHPTYFDST